MIFGKRCFGVTMILVCLDMFLFKLFFSAPVFSIAKQSSIVMELSTDNISVNLRPTSNGAFGKSSDATVRIRTDNFTGYTLSIKSVNSTDLEDGKGNTITSLNQTVSETDFNNNQTYNNTWGYRPSKYVVTNSGVNTVVENTGVYLPAPSSTGDSLDITNSPNATDNTYTIGLGARADDTIPAGSYSNEFVIIAISNSSMHNITYKSNVPVSDESTITNLPSPNPQAVYIPADTLESDSYALISSSVPARTGFTFRGWCDEPTTLNTSTNSQVCGGTIYQPGDHYGIDQTQDGTNLEVYAVWEANTLTCNRQYRLETASGGWGAYISDGSTTVYYGGSCSYSKAVTDYKGSPSGLNDSEATIAVLNITTDQTVSLDFYRNTYSLTVEKNPTHISDVTGSGTYRWGQAVSISASINTGSKFSNWSQTAGVASTFGSNTSANTSFMMPKSDATIYADGENDADDLQNWMGCGAMTTGETVRLTDSRDNQAYTVAKLADGNCWMENLNLGDIDNYPLVVDSLTSENTNLSTNISVATFNGWKKTRGSSTNTSGEYVSISGTDSTAQSPYGTLYNYCATSAGTICNSQNNNDASHDICPAGWRLPTGGSNGEFWSLTSNSSYNTSAKIRSPIANGGAGFALPGYFSNNTPTEHGTYGYYWSSSRTDPTFMYNLRVGTADVSANMNSARNTGRSVRCISKYPNMRVLPGIQYLQDFADLSSSEINNIKAEMVDNTEYSAIDNRDGQVYSFAKLKDGKIWMGNLNLGASPLSSDLTSSNTNLSTTISAATFNNWKKTSGSNTYSSAEYISQSGTDNTSRTAYGTLYNYCATSAQTICAYSNTSDASVDICPAGWRLPTGGASGEFAALNRNGLYNTNTKMRASIANGGAGFALPGVFSNGAPNSQSTRGYYWSSSYNYGTYMYALNLDNAGVYPSSGSDRGSGYSIRCVVK